MYVGWAGSEGGWWLWWWEMVWKGEASMECCVMYPSRVHQLGQGVVVLACPERQVGAVRYQVVNGARPTYTTASG